MYRLQTSGMEVSQNITPVPLGLAAEAVNPSYIELDIKRRVLFAVSEVDQGAVSLSPLAMTIDSLPNQQPTRGSKPCRLAIDKEGKALEVAPADRPRWRQCRSPPMASWAEAVLVDEPTPNLVFRPDGRFAYAANEKKSTITVFEAAGLKEFGVSLQFFNPLASNTVIVDFFSLAAYAKRPSGRKTRLGVGLSTKTASPNLPSEAIGTAAIVPEPQLVTESVLSSLSIAILHGFAPLVGC